MIGVRLPGTFALTMIKRKMYTAGSVVTQVRTILREGGKSYCRAADEENRNFEVFMFVEDSHG